MDLFRELRQYRTGFDKNGNSQFNIPLKTDENGMLGRECPAKSCQTRYFKISTNHPSEENMSDLNVTCPYCGHCEGMQSFHTQDQVKWVESMLMRDVEMALGEEFERMLRPLNQSGGLLNITVEARQSLPTIRRYVEKQLRRNVACDDCGFEFAVYGISFHCPLCGKGTVAAHLRDSVATVRVLASEAESMGEKHGIGVREAMLGNAVEDVISVFEGFMKQLYRYAVERKFTAADAEQRVSRVRTTFQRLLGAEELFRRDLDFELFDGITAEERERLERLFSKRHVVTRNLGIADAKYLDHTAASLREGQEIIISSSEILSGINLVDRLVLSTVVAVGL